MKYKKIKKAQKQSSHFISSDLIKGNRFEEIVTLFNKKSELTKQDRYLYGYSLLRTQKKLESLVALWPLAKGHVTLQEDCASIAAHVFNDENFLSSMQLSDDALSTLFVAANSLVPQSRVCSALKQRFFDSLWQKGDYEKLERILKSHKKEFSGIFVENLSKLVFFQPENKLVSNAPAFVGYILTGGACLIARNPLYHNDIAEEIRLLANEIKLLFSQLNIKNKQKVSWDKSLFENFVDYEASILTQVLQLAIKNGASKLDIIPTPSYIMAYDSTNGRVSQNFLPWLACENKELFEIYNADTYHAALWALTGENSSGINNIIKSAHQNKFHPYLRLALMLRATDVQKTPLKGIVHIKDFKKLKETATVFKNIAIQTIKSMINTESKIKLPPEFWKIVFEFSPVLQDSEFNNILMTQSLSLLHEKHKERIDLNLGAIKKIAHQMKADEFEKQIDVLCARQKDCSQLLLNFMDKKISKKIITNIKDEATLRAHLTLIADTCYLVYTQLSSEFFQHIKSLIKNKRINKLISLENFFEYDFKCVCAKCTWNLYRYEIPNMVEELKLPAASLPDIHFYSDSQSMAKTQVPKVSVLSQTDPFKILGVSFTDSKQIIMQKVMKLIQQSPEKMAIFRQAQNELFNPAQRFLHQYFRFLVYENTHVEVDIHPLSPPANFPLHEIPLRHEFLNAN